MASDGDGPAGALVHFRATGTASPRAARAHRDGSGQGHKPAQPLKLVEEERT